MRVRILPYKMGSQSARALSDVLDALRLRVNGTYLPRSGDFIINWGTGTTPAFFDRYRAILGRGENITFLNLPERVANAANKLRTFNILRDAGVSIPEFTTSHEVATTQWGDDLVYERHQLTGHSGAGIVVKTNVEELDYAPMYVRAIENHGEYRVHVVNGEVIDYIKKRRRSGDAPNAEQNAVRNLANGWVYTRENLRRLERIERLAIDAVAALGLDFGAVDIIKDQNGDVYVLEVNTACGMSDTTLAAYANAFLDLIHEHAN